MNLNIGLLNTIFPLDADGYSTTPLYIYFICLGVVLLASYFLGSVNSAIIISKIFYGKDIRTLGSGNAGMTNMLRNFGAKAAVLTLVGDLLKTVIAVSLSGLVFGFLYYNGMSYRGECYFAGLMTVIGHIFPVYYGFKGGKGVLATSVMVLYLCPPAFLVLFLLFAILVAWTRYVSLGSVVAAGLLPVVFESYCAIFLKIPMNGLITVAAVIIALLIIWCHRENLVRIGNRTENKLSFGKKKPVSEEIDKESDADETDKESDADQTDKESDAGEI